MPQVPFLSLRCDPTKIRVQPTSTCGTHSIPTGRSKSHWITEMTQGILIYKQNCRFILTNDYEIMFLQNQHNIESRKTSEFAKFQAWKMTFT